MGTINVEGKDYEVDEEGYLSNLNDWNPEIAEYMAKDEDAELTENHWEVINFLREYYDEYQIAPAVRVLTKLSAKNWVKTKVTASTYTNCSHMAQVSKLVNMQVCQSQLVAYK